MKCPFLVKRKDVFDKEGRKIGEDIEIQDCLKNECMVYDGAIKLCSLLSSNMKTGILIEDFKNGIKEIKEEMFQRAEATGVVISTTIQTMQDALLGRFDILKKQNEVIALGFDRLSELENAVFQILKENSEKITSNFEALKANLNTQGDSLKSAINSLQDTGVQIAQGQVKFAEELKIFMELLKNSLEKLTATNQLGMETINGMIEKTTAAIDELSRTFRETAEITKDSFSAMQSRFTKIEELFNQMVMSLPGIANGIGDLNKNYLESFGKITGLAEGIQQRVEKVGEGINFKFDEIGTALKTEMTNLKNETTTALGNIQNGMVKFEDLFNQSKSSLVDMSTMMNNLNKNYLESLGKIAGLAEGMRKGVEKVGEGMHDAAKDLVNEMKKDIGTLEKEYEKTFHDIAKLAGKFEALNDRIGRMTEEVEKEFRASFDRQTKLSDFTKDILKNIRDYFEKEDARYKEEQVLLKKREALDHFDRATLYFYRGNYELALNEIDKAVDIDKTAEYLNLKGLALTELARQDEAKMVFGEALELEPNLAEIYNNLGLLYLKTKKFNDAAVSFEEAIKRNINYGLAYVHLGKALIELEKFDEAINAFERALEIDPTNKAAKEAIAMYKEGKVGT